MGHPNDEYQNPGGVTGGPPVPPETFPAELASGRGESPEQGGSTSSGGTGTVEADDAGAASTSSELKPVSEMNKPELEAELGEERLAQVEGTGADGNVVVDDLRKAVTAARA